MIELSALPIFPCNLAKEALTAHGFKDAKRQRGWKVWPLVGFPTGARSGVDVLDIDPSGRNWFDANFDALPTTLAHQTQRGLHLLFKHGVGLRCSSNKIADGVDVRADGGYAIYWPTIGLPFEDNVVCEWPDWLLAEAMGTGKENWYPRRSGSESADPVWVSDLTSALRQMNAVDWRGQWEEWFELLMGCKCIGITLAHFTEWCVSDPHYANDAEKIARQWHSVVPAHGGAFWRELSRRKIKVGQGYRTSKVPLTEASASQASRSPDARLNYISNKISENPTERGLFSWACLAAEIVHECKHKPSRITQMLYGAAIGTPLWEMLGKEGIQRTISNAFRHVEEKLLETETATKGDCK